MDYVKNLVNLVCGEGGQVDMFIGDALRAQDIDNRVRGGQLGDIRVVGPRYSQTAEGNGTSLVKTDSTAINNNPLYAPNMVDALNTPFDHIERILLQDFSKSDRASRNERLMDIDGENYFKSLFSFAWSDGYVTGLPGDSVASISMSDSGYPVSEGFVAPDYSAVNGKFASCALAVDSFTYTPFVDYSLVGEGGDARIGVHSDGFLSDFNSVKYERGFMGRRGRGQGDGEQADRNRHPVTSTLFELGNLKRDLEEAKTSFRAAVAATDGKTGIYTFCEHLATLFAKLSNIRMSHVIYGFKHPHHEWEGVLALDIWYQMLHRAVDMRYPFDEGFMSMNPMTSHDVVLDGHGVECVEFGGVQYPLSGQPPPGRAWGDVDPETGHAVKDSTGHVLLWNESLWERYDENSRETAKRRGECVTPRGFLAKLCQLLADGVPEEDVCSVGQDGDFPWFSQRGMVYSDSGKSIFSKHVNLHLGRAYEAMSAEQYGDLMGLSPVDGNWVKPAFETLEPAERALVKAKMVRAGCRALQDAFWVLVEERQTTVYNSKSSRAEEFQCQNADGYSQAQCAVAVERVFSRLYKYLQFKSTTGEVVQRHINIDSGYKYLSPDSIRKSQNPESTKPGNGVYWDDGDEGPKYLRYLAKLDSCRDAPFLNPHERAVLGKFVDILMRTAVPWLAWNWDLCPLCQTGDVNPQQDAQGEMREASTRAVAQGGLPGQSGTFTVTFGFRELVDGAIESTERSVDVPTNAHLPRFHIHQEVGIPGTDRKLVFRYWRLDSGNLTSSLTVVSPLHFTAVYDEI